MNYHINDKTHFMYQEKYTTFYCKHKVPFYTQHITKMTSETSYKLTKSSHYTDKCLPFSQHRETS